MKDEKCRADSGRQAKPMQNGAAEQSQPKALKKLNLNMARTVKSWSQQAATLLYPVRLRGAPPLLVCSLRVKHGAHNPGDAGSSPAGPTICKQGGQNRRACCCRLEAGQSAASRSRLWGRTTGRRHSHGPGTDRGVRTVLKTERAPPAHGEHVLPGPPFYHKATAPDERAGRISKTQRARLRHGEHVLRWPPLFHSPVVQ